MSLDFSQLSKISFSRLTVFFYKMKKKERFPFVKLITKQKVTFKIEIQHIRIEKVFAHIFLFSF